MTQPPRGRGRPRSFDPELALGRALEVFWDRGFAAVSMDELAMATGLNRPNLNAAFGDKRALYLAAVQAFRGRLQAGVAATLLAPGPPHSRLKHFFDAAVELYTSGDDGQRGCLIMCTAPAEAVRDTAVRAVFLDVQTEIDTAMTRLFQDAVDRGEVDAQADVTALAAVGTAVLQSLALRARAGLDPDALRTFADASIRLLLPGSLSPLVDSPREA